MNNLQEIHDWLFKDWYTQISRDQARIKKNSEFFTPRELIEEMLDQLELQDPTLFSNPEKTWLDPACGDGNFPAAIFYRRLERGLSQEEALSSLFGVDICEDNIKVCQERLSLGKPNLLAIAEENFTCEDFLS